MNSDHNKKEIAIYHEHKDWFRPLFDELKNREIPFITYNAAEHYFRISEEDFSYDVFFNRMSPSAYLRNNTQAIFQDRVQEFEKIGVDFFLLQASPQLEEMERFSEVIISEMV